MTIPREAIEAAAQGLVDEAMRTHALTEDERHEEDHIHPEMQIGDDPLWISGRVDLIASAALTAALPALERQIREQVAKEIEAARPAVHPARKGGKAAHYALTNAARIARGYWL